MVQRRPQFLIALRHLLMSANSGHVPTELLGGQFRIVRAAPFQVLYQQTHQPLPQETLDSYRENIGHPAYVRAAFVQGSSVSRGEMVNSLPFLAGRTGEYSLDPSVSIELHLPDVPVYELWIDSLVATSDADVIVAYNSAQGGVVFRDRQHVGAGQSLRVRHELNAPATGGVFTLAVATAGSVKGSVLLSDIRVLGQTPSLRAHVEKELIAGRLRRPL
jgi:hypothetical protein